MVVPELGGVRSPCSQSNHFYLLWSAPEHSDGGRVSPIDEPPRGPSFPVFDTPVCERSLGERSGGVADVPLVVDALGVRDAVIFVRLLVVVLSLPLVVGLFDPLVEQA